MPRTCIHLELFTHCWSFINSGQDCKVSYCRGLCSSSWAKTTEVPNISSCIQLVPVSHHWEAELRYSHLYLVVLVLLLLQGCSLLLFLGLSKGVIILSNITIRPRGKHLKSRTTKMDPDSMQSRFSVCDSQLCQAPMAPCTSRRLLKHPAVELLSYILLVCGVRKHSFVT